LKALFEVFIALSAELKLEAQQNSLQFAVGVEKQKVSN